MTDIATAIYSATTLYDTAAFYLHRCLASGGIVALGVALCVSVCVCAEPLISHIDCMPH